MCMGGDGDADVKRHNEIEKLIRQDEKRMSKEVKLLLLGTSHTAATTAAATASIAMRGTGWLTINRGWREWKVDYPEADEADSHVRIFEK